LKKFLILIDISLQHIAVAEERFIILRAVTLNVELLICKMLTLNVDLLICNASNADLGAVYKRRSQSGGEEYLSTCPVRTFCGKEKGLLQMRAFALFDKKKLRVRTNKWGLSQCGHFANKRGGCQFFTRLFWTAPKHCISDLLHLIENIFTLTPALTLTLTVT